MFYIKNPLLVAYLALIMLYVKIFLPEIISTGWESNNTVGQTNTIGKRSQCRWNDEYIVFVPKHRTQIQIFCHCSVWGFSRVCGGRRASDRSRYNWLTIRRPRGSLGNSPTRHVVCFNCLSFPIWTKAWSTSSRQEPRTIKRFYSGISAVGRSWPAEQTEELVIKDKGGGRTE